ncbi:MAG: DegV family protein [Lachnospiraceae bacterium]|nr:DegV family protein [Lachnospiraceae bacterium]
MNGYIIYTDSACDVDGETLKKWGVMYRSLTFLFADSSIQFSNDDMSPKNFYKKMREGGVAKTSAVNINTFIDAFTEALNEGKDILYIGFSTGLSTTAESAESAARELRPKYPERKIITIDTLCASGGLGLILYLAVLQKRAGKSIEDVEEYVRDMMPHLCHWFTVEDLVYLRRGGRIGRSVALVGSVLGIKPVMHVDNEGHLVKTDKARGRRASIKALADKYDELCINHSMPVFISHGDCEDDARLLADMIREKHGEKEFLITFVGPVIGAHSGPGTLALFFIGSER